MIRRKLTPSDISEASRRYQAGDSLATIGKALRVNAKTVREELHRAGTAIRRRRGW
ncbi:MAG: helix-turn-helix domain-containing protein [Blastocatellia bacterium]